MALDGVNQPAGNNTGKIYVPLAHDGVLMYILLYFEVRINFERPK